MRQAQKCELAHFFARGVFIGQEALLVGLCVEGGRSLDAVTLSCYDGAASLRAEKP